MKETTSAACRAPIYPPCSISIEVGHTPSAMTPVCAPFPCLLTEATQLFTLPPGGAIGVNPFAAAAFLLLLLLYKQFYCNNAVWSNRLLRRDIPSNQSLAHLNFSRFSSAQDIQLSD